MNIISQRINESIAVKQQIANDTSIHKNIQDAEVVMQNCLENGGSVYFCGNGGSAADAQHLAAELSGKFYLDRKPLSSDALHCNTSFLTAVANDYSYNEIYARLITGVGREGDVLVGLSTSGNSKNIIKAFEECRSLGIKTIALTGASGGKMKEIADITICVPSTDTPRIQESHITIGHIICEIIEENMFGDKNSLK